MISLENQTERAFWTSVFSAQSSKESLSNSAALADQALAMFRERSIKRPLKAPVRDLHQEGLKAMKRALANYCTGTRPVEDLARICEVAIGFTEDPLKQEEWIIEQTGFSQCLAKEVLRVGVHAYNLANPPEGSGA